jgi:hypothetical protein
MKYREGVDGTVKKFKKHTEAKRISKQMVESGAEKSEVKEVSDE